MSRQDKKSRRYSAEEIEHIAREHQVARWKAYRKSEGRSVQFSPFIFNPGESLHALGYEVRTVHSLGEINYCGRRMEAAGLINQKKREVQISARYSFLEQRFTTAHELAHAVLHPLGDVFHHDRPINGGDWHVDPIEREANRFASAYLMPAQTVKQSFFDAFGLEVFTLTEETAFSLATKNLDVVRSKYRDIRDRSLALATTIMYGGRAIRPLREQFGVTETVMARRLEELGLVK